MKVLQELLALSEEKMKFFTLTVPSGCKASAADIEGEEEGDESFIQNQSVVTVEYIKKSGNTIKVYPVMDAKPDMSDATEKRLQKAFDRWCAKRGLSESLTEAKKVNDDDYFIVIPDDMPGRDHMDLYTEKAFPSYDAAESYVERLKRSAMNSRDADTDEGDEELEELENVDIVSGARLKSKYPKLFEGLNEAKSEIAQHRANLKKVINAWHNAVGGHDWIPETKANYKKLFGVQPGDEDEDDLNFTPEDYAQEAFDGYIHSVYPDKKAKDAIVYDVDWGSASRNACVSFLKKLLKSRNIKYDVKGNRDGIVFTPQ